MNKSFKLTEKGQKQLEAFKERQVRELLDDIIRIKDYPGVDEIEITGNDIDECSKKWVFIGHNLKRNRYSFLKTSAYIYMILGLIVLFVGTFYEDLKRIYEDNPMQISFMLAGVFISLLGALMLMLSKNIESRKKMFQSSTNNS